jgi:hypothetical protein
MKKSFILSILLFFFFFSAQAQAPDTAWTRTYHRADTDDCRFIVELSDGGFAMVGQSHIFLENQMDILLIRTDSEGDVIWTHTYGDEIIGQEAYCVKADADNGFVIAGIKHLTPTIRNAWIIKTDSNGDTLWTTKYGGVLSAEAKHVSCTSDNGYIVTGIKFNPGYFADAYLLKLNSNGEIEWDYSFGDAGYQAGTYVQQTSDGGYMLAGYSQVSGKGYDFYLIKTDESGTEEWSKTCGGISNDYCTSAAQTFDDGYIMFGESDSYIPNSSLAFRTNSEGDSIWSKTYKRSVGDYGQSVAQTSDSGFIFGGYSNNPGKLDDFWFIRTEANGDTLWMKTVGYGDYQRGYCVLQSSDGGYVLAGSSFHSIPNGTDYYVVKLLPIITNINENSLPGGEITLSQNYPNPFKQTTKIEFQLRKSGSLALKVYDFTGREMVNLVDEFKPAGKYEVEFNGAGLKNGIYFYTLITGDFIETKKMFLIK